MTWLLSHLVQLTVDISEQLNISTGSPGGEMDGDGIREGVRKEELRKKREGTSEVETTRGIQDKRDKTMNQEEDYSATLHSCR